MTKQNISKQIEALLDNLDSQEDIASATQLIHKRFVERSLNAELDEHLGYDRHKPSKGSNTRNGSSSKTLYTDDGEIEIDTPRDRDGSFSPEIIKKRQRRIATLDSKITYLYSQGLTTREITETVSELYNTEVSPALVSRVTDASTY